jgi:tRNA-splicing ligase RtcB (3'-phosphate/5'-hydroxy nucleic acid ligase)
MSRSKALNSITQSTLKEQLQKHGVKLLGGGLDEAPNAYKDIEVVMKSQSALVDIVGKFSPKIVKMDGSTPKKWQKTNALDGE